MASNTGGIDHTSAQVCILFIAHGIGYEKSCSSVCFPSQPLSVHVAENIYSGCFVGQINWIPALSCAILLTSTICTFVIHGILTSIHGQLHYQNYGVYRKFGKDLNTPGSREKLLGLIIYSTYSYSIRLVEVHPRGLLFISLLHFKIYFIPLFRCPQDCTGKLLLH